MDGLDDLLSWRRNQAVREVRETREIQTLSPEARQVIEAIAAQIETLTHRVASLEAAVTAGRQRDEQLEGHIAALASALSERSITILETLKAAMDRAAQAGSAAA
jgi:chromosome segregation ATPase